MKALELNSEIIVMKNLLGGLKSSFELAEKIVNLKICQIKTTLR